MRLTASIDWELNAVGGKVKMALVGFTLESRKKNKGWVYAQLGRVNFVR